MKIKEITAMKMNINILEEFFSVCTQLPLFYMSFWGLQNVFVNSTHKIFRHARFKIRELFLNIRVHKIPIWLFHVRHMQFLPCIIINLIYEPIFGLRAYIYWRLTVVITLFYFCNKEENYSVLIKIHYCSQEGASNKTIIFPC